MTERRDDRAIDSTDDTLDPDRDEALEGDRPGGWAGVDEALGGTGKGEAGPDAGASSLDDETPGSQGEIESGSEGDFGTRDEPRS
jgi:hypothetical protein